MPIVIDIYYQICDIFYTKEQWNKHLYSSRHIHRAVNDFWPAFFPKRKLTRDEGIKLEKTFWEMTYNSNDNDSDLALFEFLKIYYRLCTNITDHVPIRYWDYYNDGNEEEQWGYSYREVMIAQFEQD